ncbi:MAG: conserved hypothetical protein [Methanobrevibacter sp. CfCl-M3]
MEKKLQKLPLGRHSFKKIRENNYLYVDKTKEILELINKGDIYFLSRPRRFGKSLLVSTLKELFEGNEELFKDLYIHDKWNWSGTCPVINLNMAKPSRESKEKFEKTLSHQIFKIATKNGISIDKDMPPSTNLSDLIEELHDNTGKDVVVLIDEYDKGILDNISNTDLAIEIRDLLREFYEALKNSDEYIKFIFITGVTKFSKASIFSGLNNPDDITLDNNYSTICGYTKGELRQYFSEYLEDYGEKHDLTIESLIDIVDEWYDGYSWDGESFLYNPYSILSFFKKDKFDNYWFESGTPSFLIRLIEKNGIIEDDLLKPKILPSSAFSMFKIKNLNLTTVLMQTGYLTVKNRREIDRLDEYTLDVPNNEVKESLFAYLLSIYTGYDNEDILAIKNEMLRQINDLDSERFNNNLNQLLSEIPNLLHQKADDNYYHSIFITWLITLRFKVDSEVLTNIGRLDSVLESEKFIAICEIKHDDKIGHDKLINEALNQIKEKLYYEKYLKENKRIILIAIAFHNKQAKTVMEELKV